MIYLRFRVINTLPKGKNTNGGHDHERKDKKPDQRDELIRCLFRHTTTLGVRESACLRSVLRRGFYTVQTEAGPVRFKTAEGFGVSREKAEFEDLARIAREQGISLREAAALAELES